MSEPSDSAQSSTRGEATTEDGTGPPLVCWLCRRPVDRRASIRWRGELVHSDCVGHAVPD